MAVNPRLFPGMGQPVAMGQTPGGNDVAALLKQFTPEPRFLDLPLSPNAYRNAAVVLKDTLQSSSPTGQDQFRVPTTHNMVIWGMSGHIANVNPNGADEAALTYGGGAIASVNDLRSGLMQKAMLVTLDLQNADRNEKLIEGRQLSLADILALIGGCPITWHRAPHIVMGGQTLHLDLGLAVSTTADIGDDFEAGVILDVTFVRCREG